MWRLICGASVVDCFCFHAKCGVDSRARAPPLCPGGIGHSSTLSPFGGGIIPFAILTQLHADRRPFKPSGALYTLYIYMEIPYRILYSSSQDLPCYAT